MTRAENLARHKSPDNGRPSFARVQRPVPHQSISDAVKEAPMAALANISTRVICQDFTGTKCSSDQPISDARRLLLQAQQ